MLLAEIKKKQEELRDSYRQKRISIPSDDRAILHQEITRILLKSVMIKQCKTVAAYLNLPSEVNLSEFIRKAQERGQSVCVPVTDKTKRVMEFRDLPVDFERQKNHTFCCCWTLTGQHNTHNNDPATFWTRIGTCSSLDSMLHKM